MWQLIREHSAAPVHCTVHGIELTVLLNLDNGGLDCKYKPYPTSCLEHCYCQRPLSHCNCPNISLTTPSGQPKTTDPNPSSGPLLQLKDTLHQHCIIQIHQGNSSIWSTPWCNLWESIHSHLNLPVTQPSLPLNVAELWILNTQIWNTPLISSIFSHEATQEITQLQTVPPMRLTS